MSRRKSRETAMRIIYSTLVNGDEGLQAIENFKVAATEEELKDVDFKYVEKTVMGTLSNKEEIEESIESNLKSWKLSRLSKINRAILNLAVYEIKFEDSIPAKVAINEAIEIAKQYAEDKSSELINGVLDNYL